MCSFLVYLAMKYEAMLMTMTALAHCRRRETNNAVLSGLFMIPSPPLKAMVLIGVLPFWFFKRSDVVENVFDEYGRLFGDKKDRGV
jgi:hypothetical protein